MLVCISNQFKLATKNLNIKLSYIGINKLKRFIKVHKDKLVTELRNNVVYKISCKDCDASYFGQTRRLLKTRINPSRTWGWEMIGTHVER